jgi:type VI secretion system protein ImpG
VFSKYYQQELFHLRQLAREFAEVHPAIAPMLSAQSADPDVERLLEGTAFLSGLLREKIDDQFPEIIHALTGFVFPQFLTPVPSVTIVRFTPKKGLQESLSIPAGTELASRPVDDVSCLFQTSFDCQVHPLLVASVSSRGSSTSGQEIRLELSSTGPDFESWMTDRLSFFIGGSYAGAGDLFYLLSRKLKQIRILSAAGETVCVLDSSALRPAGFDRQNPLLPYPGNAFSGYRFLQEFFLLPHKFLFLELTGLSNWTERRGGKNFSLLLELEPAQLSVPVLTPDSFLLGTVPAVNLYSHDAEPMILDHTRERIRVVPAMRSGKRPEIFSIDQVTGFTRGAMQEVKYSEASRFTSTPNQHIYSTVHSISPVHNRPEIALQFSYPPEITDLVEETLSIRLTCMDGDLPRRLKPGDICQPTSSTPALVEFSNLMQPTMPIDPPLGGDLLWQLLSQISLNLLSLDSVENVSEQLRLYIFDHDRDRGRISANRKRLDGLEEFRVERRDQLLRGHLLRGRRIHLTACSDNFAGKGDFCLFGMVLDVFFAEYCSFNSFTQFELTDSVSGETYAWPLRVGSKTLI